MSHHHDHHHHHAPDLQNINRAFYIGIALNIIFTIIEFVVGYAKNSLALIADASHNLSDVASLVISLIGMKLAQKSANYLYTYGYKKASILASLINAILLVYIVINIIIEGIERLNSVPEVGGKAIIITACIGILINSISAFLFFKGQKDDINIKGAFLHLLVDAIVSVGVVISGVIIYYTNWNIIDPIISFIIAIVILFSTWGLLKESVKLVLDGVPKDIDPHNIEQVILQNEMISKINHLHIWAISSSQNALTVHIVLEDGVSFEDFLSAKHELKHELIHHNIHHSTIELDKSDESETHC
ncbi:MAG: cation transporter [Flavobacteriales bacterium]|nr:MAG: cation transporter [Flavobacteriales bacterium]